MSRNKIFIFIVSFSIFFSLFFLFNFLKKDNFLFEYPDINKLDFAGEKVPID
jgi:hypothetical protein